MGFCDKIVVISRRMDVIKYENIIIWNSKCRNNNDRKCAGSAIPAPCVLVSDGEGLLYRQIHQYPLCRSACGLDRLLFGLSSPFYGESFP